MTALAFWDQNVVLAGEGIFLKAYDIDRKSLLAAVPIFEGQAIHGIVVAENDHSCAAIWGGQHVCRAKITWSATRQLEVKVGPKKEANDWILDVAFSDSQSNGYPRIAMVTAHNALQLLPANDPEKEEVEPLVPGSNCILYCAHVRWLSGSQCLVASGTAFGDVIIWSCVFKVIGGELSVQHQTHYTFSAHEGSVFGVQLSSPAIAEALAGRQRVLATCSDDRTIRLWDISDLSVKSPALTEQQRQTGFGSTQSNDTYAPPVLAKVMGHISRIWHVRFEQSKSPGEVSVLSFGEDASNITWTIAASAGTANELPYSLQQADLQRAHNGKNIWSLEIKSPRIATGGADGGISLQHFSPTSIDQQASSHTANFGNHGDEWGVFRAYGFVDASQLMASTDKGCLFLASANRDDKACIKISDPIAGLRGYSTMTTLQDLAFVAGSDGLVYMYQHKSRTVNVIARTGRKVAGLFAQSLSINPYRIGLLVTNMGKDTGYLYYIDEPNSYPESKNVDMQEISTPSGFVTTSFAGAHINGHTFVFLGSRNGSITVVDTTNDSTDRQIPNVRPHVGVHAGETVTKLCVVPGAGTSESLYLLSTGRDGTYAVHQATLAGCQLRMNTVHQVSLPFGPNIESLGFSTEGHLWIWGFRSTQFVVFDVQTQQEVMAVGCGGAHRIWSFQANENGGTFVWTKASKLYSHTQPQLPCQLINSGGHGREIKCTAVSPGEPCLIATGAEDTDIKLSVYQDGTFRLLHTLQKHNTGIQHLQWSNNGKYLFSSGGFEELFVWRITKDIAHIGIGVICESRHPRSGSSDLRIMSFDVQDCVSEEKDVTTFRISTVYSDSTLGSWHYQPQDRTWILLATGDYLTSCLTQCLHLYPASPHPKNAISLMTGSTDGHIALWNHSEAIEQPWGSLQWTTRHKIHQNAILALVSCNLPDKPLLLITGGDDNAIGITRVPEGGNGGASWRTLLVSRAHAAAVTALCVVKVEDSPSRDLRSRLWLVSASIDQRIKLWSIDVNREKDGIDGVDVMLIKNVFTSVADVSSMESMRVGDGNGVLVCGVGMDVWKIDESVWK